MIVRFKPAEALGPLHWHYCPECSWDDECRQGCTLQSEYYDEWQGRETAHPTACGRCDPKLEYVCFGCGEGTYHAIAANGAAVITPSAPEEHRGLPARVERIPEAPTSLLLEAHPPRPTVDVIDAELVEEDTASAPEAQPEAQVSYHCAVCKSTFESLEAQEKHDCAGAKKPRNGAARRARV